MRTRQRGQSALLLLDVVDILDREKVPYAVVGAFALSVHGVVRASTDADALLSITRRQLQLLRPQFERAGLHTELRLAEVEDPVLSILVVSDDLGNKVDLLGGLRGMDEGIFDRTVEIAFQGVNLRFAGLEDFIAMKCFAGGPQDLLDAQSAYLSAQGPVNLDLLRRISRRFGRGAADHLEQILPH